MNEEIPLRLPLFSIAAISLSISLALSSLPLSSPFSFLFLILPSSHFVQVERYDQDGKQVVPDDQLKVVAFEVPRLRGRDGKRAEGRERTKERERERERSDGL
jgi:hypothetical protein